eukprot:jgi/Bigna1/63313/fgenesh1_kg.50_\
MAPADTSSDKESMTSLAFWVHSCRIPLLPIWFLVIWYIYIVAMFGAGESSVWGNAVGIGIIVGCVLTGNMYHGPFAKFWAENKWPTFRVFCIPFCVSSYSATAADKSDEFSFIFPKDAGITFGGLILAGVITGALYIWRLCIIRKGLYSPEGGTAKAHVELQEGEGKFDDPSNIQDGSGQA